MKNARRVGTQIAESNLPDVYWEIDCSCRNDGPWVILGPCGDSYLCTKCNKQMAFRGVPVKTQPTRKTKAPTVEELEWQLKQQEFDIRNMTYKDET